MLPVLGVWLRAGLLPSLLRDGGGIYSWLEQRTLQHVAVPIGCGTLEITIPSSLLSPRQKKRFLTLGAGSFPAGAAVLWPSLLQGPRVQFFKLTWCKDFSPSMILSW